MSQQLTTLSRESIQFLCGLIRNVSTLPNSVIDNINLANNTTFDSIHITDLINNTLVKANDRAEELCNALTKLTCEKTTVQPTLDNSELNVIYLFSSNGNAPFEQFLKISETELIDMGSTSISLNDYLTVTDAVNTYAKKVDLDTLTTEVTNIKSNFTTHKDDTDIHITSAERDTWNNKANDDEVIKKTDITTKINSTSTNSQVPSAKSVYDNTLILEPPQRDSDYNIDTIKNYTMTHINISNRCVGTYPAEFNWGTFLQFPAGGYRAQILISIQGMYYRMMFDGKWQPWYKVNATEVTNTTTYPKQTP